MADTAAERPAGNEEVVVLCGGVGAARLLSGMVQAIDPTKITAIVNVGDDIQLHGLHISPDLDTIVYTLAKAHSVERGWGLEGETWQAMEMVGRYGGADWFSLGDRDLGTHLFRTHQLSQGASLAEATAAIAQAWDLTLTLLPVTNDPLRTMVTTVDEGEISFQEYFVRRQHNVAVTAVRFDGAEQSEPAPGVVEALERCRSIVIAPSNPVVSIDPVLAVPGIREILERRRSDVVAVSPIVGGKALKGPAARLLVELGREASVEAVARWYRDVIGTLIIDSADADEAARVEAAGVRAMVTDTIMSKPGVAVQLAKTTLTT